MFLKNICLPIFESEEDHEETMLTYDNDCNHTKTGEFEGALMCFSCGEVIGPLFKQGRDVSCYTMKSYNPTFEDGKMVSKRVKSFNKMMNKMFPDVFLPDGNTIMNDIENRFDQLGKNAGSFPNMKVVVHFILNKCEMTDLASTITLPKSERSQNILEKLFED